MGDGPTVTAKLTYAGGVALAGKMVSIGVGGASRLGVTGNDGSVAVKMPVVADPGSYQITAAFAGDEVFQPSSASAPLTINRAAATPTVLPTGAATAGINISGALGGTNTGLQQVPVAFTVNGPNGTTTVYSITDYLGNAIFPPPSGLPPGNYTITQATFGGDGTFAPTTITFPPGSQVSVPKLNQSIELGALADKTFGDPDFQLFASASSGLAVAYGATGACAVVGSTVHLTGSGSCTITADQAGNATYNAAATVSRGFSIGVPPAPLTVMSLARAVPNPTMADTVSYTLTFSEAVTGVTGSNFAVATNGITAASVAGVSGSGATWTVTVNTGRGTGSLHLDLVNGTGITNGGGAAPAGLPATGETYSIDKGGTVIGSGEGQLVTGFGSGGYALFSEDPTSATPGRIRVRSNGSIMTVGGIGCNPRCTLQLAQFLANGAPDTSFGTNGRVVTTVTNIGFEMNFFINSDGTLVVIGVRNNGSNDVPFAAKFTSAGAPDPSFGTNGIVTLDSLHLAVTPTGSVVDASGRIIFVGTTLDEGGSEHEDIIVTRLTSAGATDTTFGTNGVAQFALSTVSNRSDRGTTVDVQPDGKILVGGRSIVTAGLGYDFLLMRLDTLGVLDPSFGVGGIATTHFPGTETNLGRKLLLQPDGKIVMVGFVAVGASNQCGIARFDTHGILDPGFGTGGRVQDPVSVGCFTVNQQSDGKLVIVAQDALGDLNFGTFIRLLQNGAPDPSFGNGGVQDITNFGTPSRVAFTSSGTIVTGLYIEDPADGVQKAYIVELTSTLAGPWLNQTITFGALPDRAFGDFFQLSATASSGLAVSYAASGDVGVCTVSGNVVQLTGVGSCTVTASQAGNATYFVATPVARTFNVTSASQAITFGDPPAGVTVGQPLVRVSATSTSTTAAPSTYPIAFTSQSPSVCTTGGLYGEMLTLHAQGTCTIEANQVGNANYSPAPPTTQSFTVDPAPLPLDAPQTYPVLNLNDVALGNLGYADSLRDAIAKANSHAGPDIIDLSGVSGIITLTQGPIQISGPLTIQGPGADRLVINGNASNRIFNISNAFPACPTLDGPDYLVSISGLRLTNGRRNVADSSGGAIYTEHSLALDAMIVDNSVAKNAGGLYFGIQYPGQTLTITNSRFLRNVATELQPATPNSTNGTNGGAMYIVEKCANATDTPHTAPVSVTIADSEFQGNGALPLTIYGRGGAIRSYSRADIRITDTIIAGNFVEAPESANSGQDLSRWRIRRNGQVVADRTFGNRRERRL